MMERISAITMPKFGLAMTEGKIASWAVNEGDEIKAGEEIADVETTKITNAYESPVSGILRRHVAPLGEDLPVGALIAVVAPADVTDDEIDAFVADFASDAAADTEEDSGAPVSKTVNVDAGDLVYLDAGPQDTKDAIVLVHGFAGDGNNWLFNLSALTGHHRVIALDLPGHGGSTKTVTDPSVSGLAKVVLQAIERIGIERVHLVGHSLGGAIALQAALDAPGKVRSLSLIAPAGLGEQVSQRFIDGVLAASKRKDMQPVLALLFADKSLVSRDMVENMLRFKRLDGAQEALSGIAQANLPQGRQAVRLNERLSELANIPVQVIWGESDEILPVSDIETLPGGFETHRLAAGHMPQMEKAGEVNRLLADFIAKSEI